jgi:hypothetical protein
MSIDTKFYENLVIRNNKYTGDVMIALEIVRKYIVDQNLILVGGFAIDVAMKMKGKKLYDEHVLPDYDFYSTRNHYDAYKIAELLYKAGLPNISVTNAKHPSTIRVRVNFQVVADVTYVPENIFTKLPTLLYRDMIIIHPHYQMIDQHRSLSLPYENAPRETILHRWKKDMVRYDMLWKLYPVKKIGKYNPVILSDNQFIYTKFLKGTCLNGFLGVLYWLHKAQLSGYKGYGYSKTNEHSIGSINIKSNMIMFKIPLDSHGVTVFCNDINKMRRLIISENSSVESFSLGDFKQKESLKERWYNRFLDKLSQKVIINNNWELIENEGEMIGAWSFSNNQASSSIDDKSDSIVWVSNLQHIMLYLLTNYILLKHLISTDRGDSFLEAYIICFNIVKWANDKYTAKNSDKYEPFLPTYKAYGRENFNDTTLNSKIILLEKTKAIKKQKLQPVNIYDSDLRKNRGLVKKTNYDFNHSKSYLYQFDGLSTKKYKSNKLLKIINIAKNK